MPHRKHSSDSNPVRSSTGCTHGARDAQNDAHYTPTDSRAAQSENAAGYGGPITRSHAIARSELDANAPIHSLPLEVLGEIFILALPSDYELCRRSQVYLVDKKISINPLIFYTVTAVCSLWRSIALSTPQLWNRVFTFVPRGITEAQAKRNAAYLVQWIERSGSLPLTLHMVCTVGMSLLGTGPDAPIISVLNHYANRWETLYHHSTEDYRSPLLSWRSRVPSSQMFAFAGWHSLQQIRSPHIRGVLHENQTVPWAQLTDLQIRAYIPNSRAINIFRECPKLVRLSIAPSLFQEAHPSPIIQHGLVTLSLTTNHLSCVLQSISLPNLRNLYLGKFLSQQLESLLGLFTRSSCNLDKLVIGDSYLAPGHLVNLLTHKSCHLLSSLTINQLYSATSIGDEILRRFTLRQHDSLCTHLQVLNMTSLIRCSPSALFNMVESRVGSHAGQLPDGLLQYLQLCIPSNLIQELEEIGTRNRVECTYQVDRERNDVSSILLRREGFREQVPVLFNGLLLDEM